MIQPQFKDRPDCEGVWWNEFSETPDVILETKTGEFCIIGFTTKLLKGRWFGPIAKPEFSQAK